MHLFYYTGLTRWLFEALTKRLVTQPPSEKRGMELLARGHMLRVKAEIMQRQHVNILQHISFLESQPLPWLQSSIQKSIDKWRNSGVSTNLNDKFEKEKPSSKDNEAVGVLKSEKSIKLGKKPKKIRYSDGNLDISRTLKPAKSTVESSTTASGIGFGLLSPLERQQRREFYDLIKRLNNEAESCRKSYFDLLSQAKYIDRQGRFLLPRIQLSVAVCNNIWLKVAAARTKESLLERVDLDDIKEALCGITYKRAMHSSTHDSDEYSTGFH